MFSLKHVEKENQRVKRLIQMHLAHGQCVTKYGDILQNTKFHNSSGNLKGNNNNNNNLLTASFPGQPG